MTISMVGGYYNISTTFPNISVTYPIVVFSIMGFLAIDKACVLKVLMAVNDKEFCQKKK